LPSLPFPEITYRFLLESDFDSKILGATAVRFVPRVTRRLDTGNDFCRHFQIMFPNPNHPPTLLSQGFNNQPITSLVCGEFFQPEFPVVRGHIGMLGTSMPEAAINKYCNFGFWENEIGFPKTGACRCHPEILR
jgi:hypothetical protein